MNNNVEIVEIIMQQRIANFIKENRNMNRKELIERVEKMLDEKDEMYNMDEKVLREELKRMGNVND